MQQSQKQHQGEQISNFYRKEDESPVEIKVQTNDDKRYFLKLPYYLTKSSGRLCGVCVWGGGGGGCWWGGE